MPKTVEFAPFGPRVEAPKRLFAEEQVPRLADRPLEIGRPGDARADDAAGAGIHAQEVGADAPQGRSVELSDADLEQDLLRAHDVEEVDDLGQGDRTGDLSGPGQLGGEHGGRGGRGGRALVLGGFGIGLGGDRSGRRRLSTAGPRRLAAGRATRAGGRTPQGPGPDRDAMPAHDGPRLTGDDRGQVGVDRLDDPGDLGRVARLAFDHDVVAELAQLDAGVGEHRPQLALDQGQVGEHADLEDIGLIPRGRDRQVAHADPQPGDPELAGADHGKLDDRRVADGDQRLGRPGGHLLLEGEDPRLVDEQVEGGVVAAQALDKRAHGAGTLRRPGRRQRHARQSRRDLALFGESRRDRQRLGLQGCRDRQRLRCERGR